MLIKASENEDSSEYLTVFKEQCVSYTMTKTSYLKYEMTFFFMPGNSTKRCAELFLVVLGY